MQFVILQKELPFPEVYTAIGYFNIFSNLSVWAFILIVLKQFKQKTWVYIIYVIYLLQLLLFPFLTDRFSGLTAAYTLGPISFVTSVVMILANFKVKAGELSDLFKVLAISLIVSIFIPVVIPVAAIYFNISPTNLSNFSNASHLFPAITLSFLLSKLLNINEKEPAELPEESY